MNEVIRYIDADTISEIPVENIPVGVEGQQTELYSVSEKLIRYDIHFKSINPVLTNEKICVHLHIDLEVQNNYKPSYSIIKRALYYAVRELSAQLGTLTKITDYSALEKVYSIWICNENIPKELQDTATGYSIRKNDMIGTTDEPEENFDPLEVIIIRRGGRSKEKIFDFLTAVFQGEIEKLNTYTDIKGNKKLEQAVEYMSGLGASILERGIEQGIEQGTKAEAERNALELFRNGVDFDVVERCIKSLNREELTEIYEKANSEKAKSNIRTRNMRR